MPTRKLVTFSTIENNELVDIELPGNVPLKELLPELSTILFDNAHNIALGDLSFFDEEGKRISLTKSLDAQKILNSERLWIQFGNQAQPLEQSPQYRVRQLPGSRRKPAAAQKLSGPGDALNEIAKDRRGSIKTGTSPELKIDQPCLLYDEGERGYIFFLGPSLVGIGRPKQGYKPDIDLSEIDIAKVSSRPHAEIEKKGAKYLLRTLKAKNGMFVNDAELSQNETRVLEDGDVLQFGFQGAKLSFRLPEPKKKKS